MMVDEVWKALVMLTEAILLIMLFFLFRSIDGLFKLIAMQKARMDLYIGQLSPEEFEREIERIEKSSLYSGVRSILKFLALSLVVALLIFLLLYFFIGEQKGMI